MGKIDRKLMTLLTIMICQFRDLLLTSLLADILYGHCLHDRRLCIRKMLINRKMKHFQKCDFLLFSIHFTRIWAASGALYVSIKYTFCFMCSEKCLRNNSSHKCIGLFSTVFEKIITNATSRNFQKVGGVTQPLIFLQG